MGLGAAMNAEKGEQGGQEKLLNIAENNVKMPTFLQPGRRYINRATMWQFDAEGRRGAPTRVYITGFILGQKADSGRGGLRWTVLEAIPIVQVRFQPFPYDKRAERGFALLSETARYVCAMKTPEKKAPSSRRYHA
jgi:hypothetical protein